MIAYETYLARVLAKFDENHDAHPMSWTHQVIGESRYVKQCIAHNLRLIEEIGVTGPLALHYHVMWAMDGKYGIAMSDIFKSEAIIAANKLWFAERIAQLKAEKNAK